MRLRCAQRIPPHVGNSQGRIGWSDAIDLAWDPTQPRRNFIFAPPLCQQLHADANAEEGATSSAYTLVQRLDHPGEPAEPPPTISECPYARQDDTIRLADCVGITGNGNRLCMLAAARSAFEGFGCRMEIARTIINNRDRHRLPRGSGKSPITSDPP